MPAYDRLMRGTSTRGVTPGTSREDMRRPDRLAEEAGAEETVERERDMEEPEMVDNRGAA